MNVQQTLQEVGLRTIKKSNNMLQGKAVKYFAKVRIGKPSMEIIAELNDNEVRYIALAVGNGKAVAIGSISK
ncbi:hypothetical protein CSV71_07345 [Sporosarcina sp. P21c]|uniref:hypothetical protein n=1 Tax=Sporosarcina sp. P21c TaxID=2048255 RepID=UPI000C1730F8|nr:hypothetical protein [Sporosarcina sp. P21c]PIC89757.1 hypothetical protein CSV71_07345 [Sporosarcina sp. P21c]